MLQIRHTNSLLCLPMLITACNERAVRDGGVEYEILVGQMSVPVYRKCSAVHVRA